MSAIEQDKPIYDDRVKEILKGLAEGKAREELAEEFEHKNWKTLDIYMRRRNFIWDSRDQTYVPRIISVQQPFSPIDSSKAGQVLALLSKEGADLKSIAQRVGFKDHLELAQYMGGKGYEWNSQQATYVKKKGRIQWEEKEGNEAVAAPSNTSKENQHQKVEPTAMGTLDRFLPFLELLEKHKDRLLDLVIPGSEKGKIPRYVVPGIAKTKTVQMMNTLDQLVVDFSREKNISQREIFEVALIEFFRNYGYETEIENMLGER